MNWHDGLEIASYVVTVITLPFAALVFALKQRKDSRNTSAASPWKSVPATSF